MLVGGGVEQSLSVTISVRGGRVEQSLSVTISARGVRGVAEFVSDN